MGGAQSLTAGATGVGTAGRLEDGGSSSGGSGGAGSLSEAGAHDDVPDGGRAPVLLMADATLMPTQGNGVTGSAHFTQNGEQVDMSVTLTGCPAGPHALHLHANAACGDNANAAGGHGPRRVTAWVT
jgi:Cu/Zn superoxide dismutase